MSAIVDVLSWSLLIAGGVFMLIGSFGLLRLPDFFTRLHPAGITDTMGSGLILAGLILQGGFELGSLKLALVFLFLMLTSPTSSHATARAALAAGLKPLFVGDDRLDDDGPGEGAT